MSRAAPVVSAGAPRLFQVSAEEEIKRVKEITIRGVGLLIRSGTAEQGSRLLLQILPSLTEDTVSVFLHHMFQVRSTAKGKEDIHPKAFRESIFILGELVVVQKEIITPYATKIIQFILNQIQNPEGSLEKLHQECAISLAKIASTLPPGLVIVIFFLLDFY